jgi:hypothetical protein
MVAWGWNDFVQVGVPPGLVVQVAASSGYALALRADGTVVAWGIFNHWRATNVPSGLTDVVQVAAGSAH